MMNFPTATTVRKRLPKEASYRHLALTNALKEKFVSDVDRIMVETDSPYMAPKPLRGEVCEPAMVVFTESALADVRGAEGEERLALFRRVLTNAESMLNRPPTAWQLGK